MRFTEEMPIGAEKDLERMGNFFGLDVVFGLVMGSFVGLGILLTVDLDVFGVLLTELRGLEVFGSSFTAVFVFLGVTFLGSSKTTSLGGSSGRDSESTMGGAGIKGRAVGSSGC